MVPSESTIDTADSNQTTATQLDPESTTIGAENDNATDSSAKMTATKKIEDESTISSHQKRENRTFIIVHCVAENVYPKPNRMSFRTNTGICFVANFEQDQLFFNFLKSYRNRVISNFTSNRSNKHLLVFSQFARAEIAKYEIKPRKKA